MSADAEYRVMTVDEVELACKGPCPAEIFVYMPSSQKYILYVSVGEVIAKDKHDNLLRLTKMNSLFVKKTARFEMPRPALAISPGSTFNGAVLGEQAGQVLQDAYRELLKDQPQDPAKLSSVIAGMADEILNAVAPDSADLKSSILKNVRNLQFMNHAAAISALGVMCAIANDFKSKTVLQQLCHAILLMDASLAELDERDLETYYRNRRELPSHANERIRNHPVKSQQIAAKLPVATDIVNQLILVHHELHNGQGYHRGVRTANVTALARVLAFAVDLYEIIKGHELNKTPIGLKDALLLMEERSIDVSLRRHQAKVWKSVADFLGVKNTTS